MMEQMTIDAWRAECLRRGDGDYKAARFKCPRCGNVASVAEFVAAGGKPDSAPVECIGRLALPMTKPSPGRKPCNWAAYGLLGAIGRGITVVFPDGVTQEVFPFARRTPAKEASRHT